MSSGTGEDHKNLCVIRVKSRFLEIVSTEPKTSLLNCRGFL